MFEESHVKPSPSVHHSTPRRVAVSRSPTFQRSDLTNWMTHTFQPRATARSAGPNPAVDFPLPSPVFTITTEGALREARGGRSTGTSGGFNDAPEPRLVRIHSSQSPSPGRDSARLCR